MIGSLERDTSLERTIVLILRVGVIVSLVFVISGLIAGPPEGDASLAMSQGLAELRGDALIAIGILVLIATPVLRVLGCLTIFLWRRDAVFAFITALVLSVLLTSFYLGTVSS